VRTWIRSGVLRATGLALMRVAGRAAASAVLVVAGACALAVGVSGPSAEAAGLTGGLRTRGGASLSTFQPAPGQLGRWETPLILLAVLLIVTGVGYGMAMLAASRRDPRGLPALRHQAVVAGPAGCIRGLAVRLLAEPVTAPGQLPISTRSGHRVFTGTPERTAEYPRKKGRITPWRGGGSSGKGVDCA
jgi:hypothetical protein